MVEEMAGEMVVYWAVRWGQVFAEQMDGSMVASSELLPVGMRVAYRAAL